MTTALPTGTVTMLFTDIEGSTRLLKQLGPRYGDLLADHRRLLREAFAQHEGREMDTQGDAFFYAFTRARHAVAAAVDAQRALAAHVWPEGAECRVRMGLHTRGARGRGGGLSRPRPPPGREDRRRRAWRADAPLRHHRLPSSATSCRRA